MKKLWIGILIIAVVALATVFFINQTKKEPDVIKIGVLLPFTGPSANHGEDAIKGIRIALEELKKENPDLSNRIELVVEDNRSNPKDCVSAMEKLIKINNVKIVIGPVSSSNTMACIPIAEKNKVILFALGASHPDISEAGDFIFRRSLLSSSQGEAIADYCYNQLGKKKAAILYINDETGIGYRNAFKSKFESLGGQIVVVDNYDKEGTDFRTQLLKLKNKKPSAIFIPSVPSLMGLILKQAKEIGLNSTFLGNYGIEGEALLEKAGNAAEGIYYTSVKMDEKFIQDFKEQYKDYPNIPSPLGFDIMKTIIEAIKRANTTTDIIKIKNELYRIDNLKGAFGNIMVDKKGDSEPEIIFKTVKNGEFVPVGK